MLGLVLFALFSGGGNESSAIFQLVDNNFVFLVIGGLILSLVGVIVRSIGRSKADKFTNKQPWFITKWKRA